MASSNGFSQFSDDFTFPQEVHALLLDITLKFVPMGVTADGIPKVV
jgi:hypothetical protein